MIQRPIALLLLSACFSAAAQNTRDQALTAPDLNALLTAKANASDLAGTGTSQGALTIGYRSLLSGSVPRTVADKLGDLVSVKDFGAVGNGTADDSAALQAALNSGAAAVYAPALNYRLGSGITVPGGVTFYSTGFAPNGTGHGARLTCDLAVPTCVTLNGVANNLASAIKQFNILRAAGAIPAGSIGLLDAYTDSSIIEDVNVVGHAIAFYFKNDAATTGIAAMVNRVYAGKITDAYVVVDSWPELRINESRFGKNGAFDQNANDFIRIQGGSTTNSDDGPNGVIVTNTQFSQGANTVRNWLNFTKQTPRSISDIELFQFSNIYVETVANGIASDATWPSINRLYVQNSIFNMNSRVPFISLNAATTIGDWHLNGNNIYGSFALAPSTQMNHLNVSDNYFLGPVSITGVANSTAAFSGNIYASNLTVTGSFAHTSFIGEIVAAGVVSNTATGTILLMNNSGSLTTTGNTYRSAVSAAPNLETSGSDFAFQEWIATASGPWLSLSHSRGTSPGSHSAVHLNDQIGAISFEGSDGSAFQIGATIISSVTTLPTSGHVPADIEFYTDNGTGAAPRIKIDQAGNLWPSTNNSNSLGTGSNKWSNIYAAGSVSATSYTLSTTLNSSTAPAISSGFGTGARISSSNGTATFRLNVGTGGSATSGVIALPIAANGWNCHFDILNPTATNLLSQNVQTASSTTSVTVTSELTSSGAATAWPASTVLIGSCVAY